MLVIYGVITYGVTQLLYMHNFINVGCLSGLMSLHTVYVKIVNFLCESVQSTLHYHFVQVSLAKVMIQESEESWMCLYSQIKLIIK